LNSLHTNVIFFITISVPAVYALLPDRKAKTYVHLFQVLFAEAERFNKKFDPLLTMTDFEPGIAKAIGLEVQLSLKLSKLSD
jgi:hypothetical protein